MLRRTLLQTLALAGAALPLPPAQANGNPPMPFIKTRDGTSLFVRDTGGAGKPVLFIHSWALSSLMWQYQIVPLEAAGYRCIAYDRRGHGRSDVPQDYGIEALADDLAQVIAARDLRDVTLVS